jgi:hypothetical protein
MHTSCEQFKGIREEAWMTEHADAMECRKVEDLIDRVHGLWDKHRQFFASIVSGSVNRETARLTAAVLRMAEEAMAAVVQRAMKSVAGGYTVDGLDRLLTCLHEARSLIVRPIARRMSERDPEGRTPDQIVQLLMRHVRFQEGRAVITEEVAAEFPCPFDPEPTPQSEDGRRG